MKKTWLKLTAIGAVCSMLTASAWAQSESQSQNDQSKDSSNNTVNNTAADSDKPTAGDKVNNWLSRHLSATGRQSTPLRATKLIGSPVNNTSGSQVGQVEDLIVDPTSGRVDFAVIALNSSATTGTRSTGSADNSPTESGNSRWGSTGATGSSSGKLVPVPWSLLKTASTSDTTASAAASEAQPTFTLNADPSKLGQAPAIDRNNWSDLYQSNLRQRIYSYFGVSPDTAAGGAESPSGNSKGAGAQHLQEMNSPSGTSQDRPQ